MAPADINRYADPILFGRVLLCTDEHDVKQERTTAGSKAMFRRIEVFQSFGSLDHQKMRSTWELLATVYLSLSSFLDIKVTNGVKVSFMSSIPLFFWSMCEASTTILSTASTCRAPIPYDQ